MLIENCETHVLPLNVYWWKKISEVGQIDYKFNSNYLNFDAISGNNTICGELLENVYYILIIFIYDFKFSTYYNIKNYPVLLLNFFHISLLLLNS